MADVTEMPPPEALETDESKAQSTETPQHPPTPTPPAKKGRRPAPGTVTEPKFFDRVAAVQKSDWGSRAYMYVYADEPVCNPKTFGSTRYMLKSSAPILDLEGLKQDYGSFKGWMTLNLRKTGKDQTDEVDRFEFEIYDPKHPPKIPKSAWANDPRNKKWLDLLPPEKPEPTGGAATMLDAMKVYKEIRNEVKEETPPAPEPTDATKSTLETMKLAKELFGAPAADANAAKPADPLTIATELAKTFMQMKADNPMVDFLTKQMDRQHEELMTMRKEIQERDKTPAAPQKGLLEQVVELASVSEKLDPLKKLFGWNGNGATNGDVRPGRTTPLDVAREIGSKILEGPVGEGIGNWISSLATRPTGTPQPTMTANPGSQVQRTTPDPLSVFIERTATPAMLRYFLSGATGKDFADWMDAGFPDELQQLQVFTHPGLPGLVGAEAIVQGYKHTQRVWTQIMRRGEPEFQQFISEFCAFKPDEGDDGIQDAEIITDETPAADQQEERIV